MAKITLNDIVSGFAATTLLDANFTAIESELNNKVLYRNNPSGEANQMMNSLDMNSNSIINASTIAATDIIVSGTSLATEVAAAAASAAAALASETAAAASETAAATSETNASTSATAASTAQSVAEDAQSYAEEWATKAEDNLISVSAGGDGSTDYSSLHHAAKSAYSASAASTSEANAASSASAASTSETNAASSASAAATSATNAATSETNAANSASAASTSEINAAASEAAAAAHFDEFDDRYLGSKASDPATDNDGDPLVSGTMYWNTSINSLRIYNGSSFTTLSNYTHPDHTGDVTSVGDGPTTITTGAVTETKIADDAVTNAKLANVSTNTIKGRVTASTGNPEDLTAAQVRTLLNVEDGATADQTKADIDALGIDAATLDSLNSTDFLRSTGTGSKSVLGNPYLAEVTLTDGATITWTPTSGTEAVVTLAGNRTLDLNAIPPAGTWLNIRVIQDATGSRTLAYSADFDFGDAGTPVLTTTANKDDVLSFRSNGSKAQYMGIAQGFA